MNSRLRWFLQMQIICKWVFMDWKFQLLCFILMWLMSFGCLLYYLGFTQKEQTATVLENGFVAFVLTALVWMGAGYGLSFGGPLFVSASSAAALTTLLVQFMFCLYAVMMVIGSLIERLRVQAIMFMVSAWIVVVYAPICFSIWAKPGWLAALGVIDGSGGLVVHVAAGVSALVAAQFFTGEKKPSPQPQPAWMFLGAILIAGGWFAFNAAPHGRVDDGLPAIILATLASLVGGALGAFIETRLHREDSALGVWLNGMIIGLAATTTGIGWLNVPSAGMIALFSALISSALGRWLSPHLHDTVDSFVMNAGGALCGGLMFAVGALWGLPVQPLIQGLGTLFVVVVAALGTGGICLLMRILFRKGVLRYEEKS